MEKAPSEKPMAEELQRPEAKTSNLIEGLLDIQRQYLALANLYEKQNLYTQRLAELIKALLHEADATIPITPQVIGDKVTAAYLVSDAVVVMVDLNRRMTSRPLQSFPPNVIVTVIEESTKELGRLISEKRRAETEKVDSLERVFTELSRAQVSSQQAMGVGPRPPAPQSIPPIPAEQGPGERQSAEKERMNEVAQAHSAADPFSSKGSLPVKPEPKEIHYAFDGTVEG
jgi:hypothetical protein